MIGIFDSGLGGLTVLKQVKKNLPQYEYVYLADSLYAPYGEKKQEVLYSRTKAIVEFLASKGCKLIIVACNTVSAKALKKIQQELLKEKSEVKVLGVIIPAIEEIECSVRNDKKPLIGILATQSTVRSKKFPQEIFLRVPNAKVICKAAPKLVPLIEGNEKSNDEINNVLTSYLKGLQNVQYLVLACTHFSILKQQIKTLINNQQLKIIDPSLAVAKRLKVYLKKHKEVEGKIKKRKRVAFYSTKPHDGYKEKMENIYGGSINKLNIVEI